MNYIGPKGLIPSRRWEAFREGLEDYEYFYLLEEAVKEAKQGVDTSSAEKLLRQIREKVDADLIYEYRRKIAREIIRLTPRIQGN